VDSNLVGNSAANNGFTYTDLKVYFNIFVAPGLGSQQASSRLSALDKYQNFCDLVDDSLIGDELNGQFQPKLKAFLKSLEKEKKPGYIGNLKSWLRSGWKKVYYKDLLRSRVDAPQVSKLGDAIRFYLTKAQTIDSTLTAYGLEQKINVQHGMLRTWLKSRVFMPKTRESIQRLEEILCTPKGALTAFEYINEAVSQSPMTAYGERARQLSLDLYRLGEKQISIDSGLGKEWRGLFSFKTSDVVAKPMQRHDSWTLRPIFEGSGGDNLWGLPYISSDNGKLFSQTAGMRFEEICAFFGSLAQIKKSPKSAEKKYDPKQFSLGWMADYELVEESLKYLKGRLEEYGLNVYTNTMKNMLEFSRSLVNPRIGYVAQKAEFGKRLISPVGETEWKEWCNKQFELIKDHIRQLEDKFTQTRETLSLGSPIWAYLQQQHPLQTMMQLVENMSQHNHPLMLSERSRKVLERDIFLAKMLMRQPMRIKMYGIATWKSDNTGNLYKRDDGTWAFRFEKNLFKNERGAAQAPYDVAFDKEFWTEIEDYLYKVRPYFNDDRPLLFVAADLGLKQMKRRTNSLSLSFRRHTKKFLPGCPGFGPHAVRHLVATEYIRNHEEGWQTAATVLHDNLDTVMKAYTFVKKDDGFKYYRKYFGELMEDWKKKKKKGGD
jgi:Fe-S cluster biosynthesis and repair protein YggX